MTDMIGHNNPPSDAEILAKKLAEENEKVLTRAKELKEAAKKIPEKIEDDETAEKAVTMIKLLSNCNKALEDARTKAKEPFLAQGRMVDTFFKAHKESMDTASLKAKKPLDEYLKEKHRLEQVRLAEAEALKRQEAQNLMAVAAVVAESDVGAAEVAFEDALEAEISSNKMAVASQSTSGLVAARSEVGTAALRTRKVGEIVDISKLDLEALRFLIPIPALQTALNGYIRAGGTELKGAKIYDETTTMVR